MKPEEVLSSLGGLASGIGAMLPGPWRPAISGLGAAIGLVGDLIAAGRDPVTTVTALRSWAQGKASVDDAIDALIASRTGG